MPTRFPLTFPSKIPYTESSKEDQTKSWQNLPKNLQLQDSPCPRAAARSAAVLTPVGAMTMTNLEQSPLLRLGRENTLHASSNP